MAHNVLRDDHLIGSRVRDEGQAADGLLFGSLTEITKNALLDASPVEVILGSMTVDVTKSLFRTIAHGSLLLVILRLSSRSTSS